MISIILIVSSCFLWSTDLLIREPLEGKIASSDLLVYEYGVAILFLTPWVLSFSYREFKKFKKEHLYGFLFIGLLGSSVGSFFLTNSLFDVGLESYSFFQFLQPFFVAILASRFLGEKFTSKNYLWLGLVLFFGLLLNAPDIQSGVFFETLRNNIPGVLASFIATLIWGSCTIVGKKLLKTYSPLFLSFVRWGVAFLACMGVVLWKGLPTFNALDTKTSATILFLSLISGFLAMVFYYKGLKKLKATSAAYLELFYPVFTFALGAIAQYSEINHWQIIGFLGLSIIIFVKVLFSEKESNAKPYKSSLGSDHSA